MSAGKVLLLVLCFFAAPILCQSAPVHSTSKANVDVFAGYLYSAGNSSVSGSGLLAGVDLNKVYKTLGFTVEFDGTTASSPPSSSNSISEWNFLIGPRFEFPVRSSSRIVPFVDGLIGTNTLHNAGQEYTWGFNNHTSVAWAFDGGLDINLSRHLAIRGQGGYLGTSLAESTYGGPAPSTYAGRGRVSAGVVFRF
jgi:opacity protein-like surface antigen